jgi:alpha-tubulin suppressor-like RCC1 family protein
VGAGWVHTIGLKSSGTVLATGSNNYGQCNVSGWADIIRRHQPAETGIL